MTARGAGAMELTSSTFQNNELMPTATASDRCGGDNMSPDLQWRDIPDTARSLALVVHDPDAPRDGGFYHWIVVDIPPTIIEIAAGGGFARPAREIATADGMLAGYMGPCPPVGHGAHHYNFTLYALYVDKIDLDPDMTPVEIEAAIRDRSIGLATLTGLYERK